MTTASKRSLHPEVIKRIGRLEIRARHIVEGLLSGMHRSPYFGQSVEFLQHREYAAGDDLRRVDWKVWAKQDRLYVKQYEEDTNLRCCLLVDTFGQHGIRQRPDDQVRLRRHGRRRAGLFAAAPAGRRRLRRLRRSHPPDDSAPHEHEPSDDDRPRTRASASRATRRRLYDVLARAAETYPRRGMMVLISDLFVDPADVQRGLRLLRQRGHDVLVLHVLDDDELDFPFARPARFEGLETADHLTCNPRALREGYLAALEPVPGDRAPQLCTRQRRLRPDPHQHAARRRPDRVFKTPPARTTTISKSGFSLTFAQVRLKPDLQLCPSCSPPC